MYIYCSIYSIHRLGPTVLDDQTSGQSYPILNNFIKSTVEHKQHYEYEVDGKDSKGFELEIHMNPHELQRAIPGRIPEGGDMCSFLSGQTHSSVIGLTTPFLSVF